MFLAELQTFVGQCAHYISTTNGLVGGMFVMGLIGGVTHCAGMCGPFVLSQAGNMTKLRDAALLPYHSGRIATYTILAILMYSLVNVLTFFSPARLFIVVPLLFMAGSLFLVNAFPRLFQIFPWLRHIALPISQSFIGRLSANVTHRFLLGMVLGLMPCGMVMAAIMAASTAPTLYATITAMMAFGAGTMPALIGVAMGGRKLSMKYPEKMARIRQGLMVWSGLWLFVMAGLMVMRG